MSDPARTRPVMRHREVTIGGQPFRLPFYVFPEVEVAPVVFPYDGYFCAVRSPKGLVGVA